ncbi:MAG: hypothetical protein ACRED2_03405, partial [Methylocella sp.]
LRTRERLVSAFCKFGSMAVPEAIRVRIAELSSSSGDRMCRHTLSIVKQFAIFPISWIFLAGLEAS